MKAPTVDKNASFIETPNGIFTAAGNWFHTTVEALQAYAGPVLVHKTVAKLLHNAELWLRSPNTLVLWVSPFLLLQFGIAPTILAGVVLYFVFSIWGPLFLTETATPLLSILDHVLTQALFYIVGMSWFAMNSHYALMSTGLLIFILLRWGMIGSLFQPWVQKLRDRMYKVPYEDQILKTVIVHAAMKHKVSLPELDKMERLIMKQIHKK